MQDWQDLPPPLQKKYPFIPREEEEEVEEEGREDSGGETSDKHRCGRTKSHLILRGGKKGEGGGDAGPERG